MIFMRILFFEQGAGWRDAQGLRPSYADSSQCGDAPAFYLRSAFFQPCRKRKADLWYFVFQMA